MHWPVLAGPIVVYVVQSLTWLQGAECLIVLIIRI